MEFKHFSIHLRGSSQEESVIEVRHESETFDFEYQAEKVSLINNGDNSWSIVSGKIDQETANVIGQEIEMKLSGS